MKRKIDLLLNLLFITLEVIGIFTTIITTKTFEFVYYTLDSNLFSLIITIIYLLYKLFNKNIPRIIHDLRFASTICLMITFLVVIFILIPSYNFNYSWFLFEGANLYFHFLCPILLFILFLFFDYKYKYNKKVALIPTIIYSVILIVLNILKLVEGPYPFLLVYQNPLYETIIWFILITGLTYFITFILNKIKTLYL